MTGEDTKLSLSFQRLKYLVEEEERLISRSTYHTTRRIDEGVDHVKMVVENTAALLKMQRDDLEHLRAELVRYAEPARQQEAELEGHPSFHQYHPPSEAEAVRHVDMAHVGAVLVTEVPIQVDELDRLIHLRFPGTTNWILDDPLVLTWIHSKGQFIWLQGSAGTGKSFLVARILEHLQSMVPNSPYVSYYFCRHDDCAKNSLANLLKTSAWQFARQDESYAQQIEQFIIDGIDFRNSSLRNLWIHLFQKPFKAKAPRQSFWVIDGLDELPQQEQQLLLNMLPDVSSQLSVLISSRPNAYAASLLDQNGIGKLLWTQNEQIAADIELFVTARTGNSKILGNQKYRDTVKATILENAGGLFLWVDLILHQLSKARTKPQLDMLIAKPPEGMFELYSQVLKSIESSSDPLELPLLRTILVLVWCAYRPLSLQELEAALELEFGEILNLDLLLNRLLGSLIVIASSRDTSYVHLIHSSFRDFLDQVAPVQSTWLPTDKSTCHCQLTSICVKGLCNGIYSSGIHKYAASFWTSHFEFFTVLDSSWLTRLHTLFTDPTILEVWIKHASYSLPKQFEQLKSVVCRLNLDKEWLSEVSPQVVSWVSEVSWCQSRLFTPLAQKSGRMWLREHQGRITDIIPYFQTAAYYFLFIERSPIAKAIEKIGPSFEIVDTHTSLSARLKRHIDKGRCIKDIAQRIEHIEVDWVHHDRVGYLMYKWGFYDDAITEYQRGIALEPKAAPEVYVHLASALRALGKYDRAMSSLEGAIKSADSALRRKSTVSMMLSSAEIEIVRGNKEGQIKFLQQAHEYDPGDDYILEQLAGAYNDLGCHDQSMALFQKMRRHKQEEKEFFGIVQMVQVTGNYEQAKEVYESSLLTYPDSSHWHRGFASAARKAGKLDDVVHYYEKAIHDHVGKDLEQTANFYYWLGDTYCFEFNDSERACQIWENALHTGMLGSEEARLRFALCEVYCDTGHHDLAESVLSKNCDVDGQYICRCFYLFKGLMYGRFGRNQQAYEWFKRGIELAMRRIKGLDDPNDNFGFQMLGKGLLFLGLLDDALVAFQQRIYDNTTRDPAGPLHRAFCDVCYDSTGIRGTRYVCQSCYDIDLCSGHYDLRQQGKLNLARCRPSHLYLPVSYSPSSFRANDSVSELSNAPVDEWLHEVWQKVNRIRPDTIDLLPVAQSFQDLQWQSHQLIRPDIHDDISVIPRSLSASNKLDLLEFQGLIHEVEDVEKADDSTWLNILEPLETTKHFKYLKQEDNSIKKNLSGTKVDTVFQIIN
jgi:tetratricopeptide (TPR) repeat protein